MENLNDLEGQVAVVTGASSGLGAHFAETLAAAGAKVAIGARRVDRLAALAQKIADSDGRALPIKLDVTDAVKQELLAISPHNFIGDFDATDFKDA